MHGIETIIKNNQTAGRIIAAQADRTAALEKAAWAVIKAPFRAEQALAIQQMRDILSTPVKVPVNDLGPKSTNSGRTPRPLGEILGPNE